MNYQRDTFSWGIGLKIFKYIPYMMLLPLRNALPTVQWKAIILADCLRILGLFRLSLVLLCIIESDDLTAKNKFWLMHVKAIVFQYSGKLSQAKRTFVASQKYASEYEMSFSYQHLGKLNVEAGEYDEAKDLFSRALVIRKKLGDNALVASTEKAINSIPV